MKIVVFSFFENFVTQVQSIHLSCIINKEYYFIVETLINLFYILHSLQSSDDLHFIIKIVFLSFEIFSKIPPSSQKSINLLPPKLVARDLKIWTRIQRGISHSSEFEKFAQALIDFAPLK